MWLSQESLFAYICFINSLRVFKLGNIQWRINHLQHWNPWCTITNDRTQHQSGQQEQSTPQSQYSFEHNWQEPFSCTTDIYLVIQIYYHHSCYLFSLVKNLLIKPCYSVTVNFFFKYNLKSFATLPLLTYKMPFICKMQICIWFISAPISPFNCYFIITNKPKDQKQEIHAHKKTKLIKFNPGLWI